MTLYDEQWKDRVEDFIGGMNRAIETHRMNRDRVRIKSGSNHDVLLHNIFL